MAFIKSPKKTEGFSDALLTAVAAVKQNGQVDIFRETSIIGLFKVLAAGSRDFSNC